MGISNTRVEFFDSRDKYLSFVNSTDEKIRIAFYLARELGRMRPSARAPFCVLDAGTGEGTVISTFLTALHKKLPRAPIVVTGKEISMDDVGILLGYLPDRFAEHEKLVFHITNASYRDLQESPADVIHIKKPLSGDTAHDFGMQLFNMSDFLNKYWALDVKDGRMLPRKKVVLTLYRKDQKEKLKNLLKVPAEYQMIIASQPFRLRRALSAVASSVLMPLLRLLSAKGRMVLIYSSGRDFTKPLLKMLYPDIEPYTGTTPAKLLAAARKIPAFAPIRTRIDTLSYNFINLYLGRSEFSLGNIITLWKVVTYVGQISDAEAATAPLDEKAEAQICARLSGHSRLRFVNNVIVFTRGK